LEEEVKMLKKLITSILIIILCISFSIPVAAIIESTESVYYSESSERGSYNINNTDEIVDLETFEQMLSEKDSLDRFFYLEDDEQVFSGATLDEDFEDNAVVIVLDRITSRDGRIFTVLDFQDVGALYVEDLTQLSGTININ